MYMKMCLELCGKWKIKATGIEKKKDNTKCWWAYEATEAHVIGWWETKIVYTFLKTVPVSYDVKHSNSLSLSNSIPRHEEKWKYVHKKAFTQMFITPSLKVTKM